MKKIIDYDLEVLKERGIYDINVLDSGKRLISLTVDLNRGQYYIIKPEDENINKDVMNAYALIKNEFIDKIASKKFNGCLVGDTKSYTKEVLNGVFNSLGVIPSNENNTDLNQNYNIYNNSEINELSLNGYLYE